MTWAEGRRLGSVTVGGKSFTYTYDRSGIRSGKTSSDGSSRKYYLVDGKAVGETVYKANGSFAYNLRYTFDENGSICGVSYWGPGATAWTKYYFTKNLQGDVTAVYRVEAANNQIAGFTKVAAYTYDAWGNVLSQSGDFATINPFRYRSYYYDTETGFYYLQSRYYDPAIGRFVSADSFASTGQSFLGYNMFAYCNNNPILYCDISGDKAVLPPHIANGLNLPPSGGTPVDINGTVRYYAIDTQNGELFEYWFDTDGNLVWGRHHSDHRTPWIHEKPHDHKGGKDKKGNNTLVGGPKPVDKNYHSPDEFSLHPEETMEYVNTAAGIAVAGIAIYQIVKWATAATLAPATGGASFAVAAFIP